MDKIINKKKQNTFMKEKHTRYGKTFEGKLESSRSKFRKDHVELTINLKFLRKLLKKKRK